MSTPTPSFKHPFPLRVAMVTGEYPPEAGGVGDYTKLLVEHMRTLGVEVRVIAGLDVGEVRVPPSPLTGERELLAPSPGRASWSLFSWRRVARLADGCQIVHIQYQAAAYALSGGITLLPLWLRLARPGLRVVTTFHDLRVPYLFPKAGPLRPLAVRTMIHFSHAALFGDPADVESAGPGPRRHWIPIGSNITVQAQSTEARATLRRSLGVAEQEVLVGYFGFANASKGLETLVEAVAHLRRAGDSIRLALIGEQVGASDPNNRATAAQLEALLASRDLGTSVARTGRLTAEAVSAYLQACDLIALPFRDGASLRRGSLIAALVHGLPIVTTARHDTALLEGNPYALRDGEHALLIPPGDPLALAAALRRLAADEALRRQLSRGAAELGARFCWPNIAQATLDVYHALVK